ncbi:MAG: transposase [Burkholderiaceae bacterium]|nr:MAG: transposase [Burkholderiaceae bacterium]
MATYKRHSTALKLQLVHAYLNGEGSYKELAARHNINHSLLVLRVQKFQRGDITEEQDQAETIADYEAKIAPLERKIGQFTMEVDFLLKKTGMRTTSRIREPPLITVGPATVYPLRGDAKS